jgi:hypothetical protein
MKIKSFALSALPGVLLLANSPLAAANTADSTISLNTSGQGSYLTTYSPPSAPSSGTYSASPFTGYPGASGYTYTDGYYGGTTVAGNTILANPSGTIAYGDLIITEGTVEPGNPGYYNSYATLLQLSTPESVTALESAIGGLIFVDENQVGANAWTYTPTSTEPGFITADTSSPSSFETTYELSLVPESSYTGWAGGMAALIPAALILRKRKLMAQA